MKDDGQGSPKDVLECSRRLDLDGFLRTSRIMVIQSGGAFTGVSYHPVWLLYLALPRNQARSQQLFRSNDCGG